MELHPRFLEQIRTWASATPQVQSVGLAGSHAKGTTRPDSDIDLIILCDDPEVFLQDTAWLGQFGVCTKTERENWGIVKTMRAYFDFSEVEFNFAPASWATLEPVDEGTRQVVSGGFKILYDRADLLSALVRTISSPS